MSTKVSKAQVAIAEQQHHELEERLNLSKAEVQKQQRVKYEHQVAKDQITDELKRTESFVITRRSECSLKVSTLQQLAREKKLLESELKESDEALRKEQAALKAAQVAKQRLDEVRFKLRAVREELRLLSSAEAKKAAAEAAGADLPTDVVPAPTEEVAPSDEAVDMHALWVATGAGDVGKAQVPAELRPSMQSQAALEALYRSLLVRAGELREGLRQWGFAQHTTERTKELSTALARSVADNSNEAVSLKAEHSRLASECKADREASAAMSSKVDELQKRHSDSKAHLANQTAAVKQLEAQRESDQRKLEQAKAEHGNLTRSHKEAEELLEKCHAEIAAHPAEAERRTAAAGRLAERAREQVKKTQLDCSQTKQELASFKQAFEVLKEAHEALKRDLEGEREAHDQLRDEHDNLNTDLNALARHYLDLLPKGLSGISGSDSWKPLTAAGNPPEGKSAIEVS
mmetsp:Transcript_70270/g.121775  ORF Transcript_70270/g.121775 Transcript_70270/m.121775 type:complete len:462 (+) Transcript_70270:116-1501(+)